MQYKLFCGCGLAVCCCMFEILGPLPVGLGSSALTVHMALTYFFESLPLHHTHSLFLPPSLPPLALLSLPLPYPSTLTLHHPLSTLHPPTLSIPHSPLLLYISHSSITHPLPPLITSLPSHTPTHALLTHPSLPPYSPPCPSLCLPRPISLPLPSPPLPSSPQSPSSLSRSV